MRVKRIILFTSIIRYDSCIDVFNHFAKPLSLVKNSSGTSLTHDACLPALRNAPSEKPADWR
ncbi:MAG: hypothetical protein ACK5RG_15880 [Cyclobacteriaceae bacterium]|jgi:hypothetical protein|nr:hypothetical protein [Flammeovirgaceae bacterium]